MNLMLRAFSKIFPHKDAARMWFEKAHWPNGPECCHCGWIGNAAYVPK